MPVKPNGSSAVDPSSFEKTTMENSTVNLSAVNSCTVELNSVDSITVEACADAVIAQVGDRIVLGLPLGIGKPAQFTNALYRRVKANPALHLTILTALTLEPPHPKGKLEKAFFDPIAKRLFAGYVGFDFLSDLKKGQLPSNIVVKEFFFKSGSLLGNQYAQQHYINTNYTYAARDLNDQGVNVVAQMISKRSGPQGEAEYSLSCNPEIFLDLVPLLKKRQCKGEKIVLVGQVNEQLPFMENDAQIAASAFDFVIARPEYQTPLFCAPKLPVSNREYAIGLYASTLIKDGGTLQIGIGGLGDTIVQALQLRQDHNTVYQKLVKSLGAGLRFAEPIAKHGGLEPFATGLYANTEMFVDGFLQLIKCGILKREVYDDLVLQTLINEKSIDPNHLSAESLHHLLAAGLVNPELTEKDIAWLKKHGFFRANIRFANAKLYLDEQTDGEHILVAKLTSEQRIQAIATHCLSEKLSSGIILHGGFFLGNQRFYQALRDLPREMLRKINMTKISYVNQLYGNESLKRAQRSSARFINSVFKVTLLGAATSDTLDNGQVVSGVGGQYNFVAQAHELEDGLSVLLLKSTYDHGASESSNITWNYGRSTIPRHLRDVYITEYGIADVRGKTDSEVIMALLNISDSRFQTSLLKEAQVAGKVPQDYQIPAQFCQNTPEILQRILTPYRAMGHLPSLPLGGEFDDTELVLALALKGLKKKTRSVPGMLKLALHALFSSLFSSANEISTRPYLERLNLLNPSNLGDKLVKKILTYQIGETLLQRGMLWN